MAKVTIRRYKDVSELGLPTFFFVTPPAWASAAKPAEAPAAPAPAPAPDAEAATPGEREGEAAPRRSRRKAPRNP